MEVIVKKSIELTEADFSNIVRLYEDIFQQPMNIKILRRQYEQNPFGFAWLSLLLDGGRIVGVNTYVPSFYIVKDQPKIFANSIDSMVEKSYRDFFNFNDMVRAAYKTMQKEGVDFVLGYPNDNAFPILIKGKLMKSIGKMHIYCLPYRIGGIKPILKILNPLSILFCKIWNGVGRMFASEGVYRFPIHKQEESYNETRYRRGEVNYLSTSLKGGASFFFKITEHDGVRTAFIIDIDKKSPKNFNRAVSYLLKNYSKEFDLILYPGWLPFLNTGMIRLPRKLEPKNFNFTGKMLAKKGDLPESMWNIENWDTNLSNYDLI